MSRRSTTFFELHRSTEAAVDADLGPVRYRPARLSRRGGAAGRSSSSWRRSWTLPRAVALGSDAETVVSAKAQDGVQGGRRAASRGGRAARPEKCMGEPPWLGFEAIQQNRSWRRLLHPCGERCSSFDSRYFGILKSTAFRRWRMSAMLVETLRVTVLQNGCGTLFCCAFVGQQFLHCVRAMVPSIDALGAAFAHIRQCC
jgi:hypothetical protein